MISVPLWLYFAPLIVALVVWLERMWTVHRLLQLNRDILEQWKISEGYEVTHYYCGDSRRPGHDYTFDPESGMANGWGHGIGAGDYLILDNDGGTTRYQVDEITYYPDPPDMWRAKLTFAPRPVTP